MNPSWKKPILIAVVVAALAGLIVAFIFGRHEAAAEAEREHPVKAPSRVEVVNGENVVTFDQATRVRSDVELGTLQSASHRQQIRAYGEVIDLSGLTDLRYTLESAKAQVSKASAARGVAQMDYERVKGLYDKDQNASQKALQAAEGTLRGEESNVQIAQAALTAAQATAIQQWGKVIADWLARGAPEIERLRLQEDLLIQVSLSPGPLVSAVPQQASIETADAHLVEARFVSSALRTDPKIQGQSFFFVMASVNAGLLPGMSVSALLPIGQTVQGVMVPRSTIVWLQGKAWVYVQLAPDHFARREVSTEQPAVSGWFQAQGFSPGQPFVSKGAQALLSEEFRAKITVGEEGK